MRDKLYQHEFDKLGSELKLHAWSRRLQPLRHAL